MDIESIETVYNNIAFRSRLEARWAIFWDTLNVKYEYEPEKFDLGEIKYIPDFWLPEIEKWVEIKGQMPNDTEVKKAHLLSTKTQQDIVIFSGLVQFQTFMCEYCAGSHYVTLPSGVGITYFWGKTGATSPLHLQIDEFSYVFLKRPQKTNDPHLAFSEIHLAFRQCLAHKFPYAETESNRKTFEKLIAEFRKINIDGIFEE
jgi:hypothetical protein